MPNLVLHALREGKGLVIAWSRLDLEARTSPIRFFLESILGDYDWSGLAGLLYARCGLLAV